MVAIIPAAGKGLRMAGVTVGASKEALPLGGRTVLDVVLDEAFAAGVERCVVVTHPDKTDVQAIVAARTEPIDLRYQREQLGLGHAIAAAMEKQDALVMLPDAVFAGNPSLGLIEAAQGADGAVLAEMVEEADVRRYGIIETQAGLATKLLEKPDPTETTSRLAVAARYVLTDRILRLLEEEMLRPISEGGERDLTSTLNKACFLRMKIRVVCAPTPRFDCGSPSGYDAAKRALGA